MFPEDIQSISTISLCNRFQLQFRFLHSEVVPDKSSNGFYNKCKASQTEEFIDSKRTDRIK